MWPETTTASEKVIDEAKEAKNRDFGQYLA
jgi:hypothetical protein